MNQDDDDFSAFREQMGDVDPLRQDGADPYRKRRAPRPLGLSPEEDEDLPGDLNIETGPFLSFQRPGVQHRVFRDLERGHISPDQTLDLHGMRVQEARQTLVKFLNHATARGQRCARIIHGKGLRSDHGQPVLKQKVNQWLRQREEVLAFCSAPRWDGGTGAVYVLLSRKFRKE